MLKMKTNSIIIVVVLCVVQCSLCKEGVSYKLQRTACSTFNKAFVYNSTCHVRHVNRTTQLLNFDVNLQPNVSITQIRLVGTSYFKFRTVFRQSVFNYSDYVCDSLNNGTFSHYLNAIKASYAKYSNALEPCPKSGHIYAKNLVFDSSKFPQFIPIGEYRFDAKYFTSMNGEEEFIFMTQDYVEVKPLGIEQF